MTAPAPAPVKVAATAKSLYFLTLLLLTAAVTVVTSEKQPKFTTYTFGFPFNETYYTLFSVESPATISNNALQITPDSAGNFTLINRSGRILFNRPFLLFDDRRIASFNTSFLINIFHLNTSAVPGEGMAFVVAPDTELPPGSDGEFLGLTNSSTDGNPRNEILAVEFDTFKQDFDPDDNHIGIDVNSVKSKVTASMSKFNITLAPTGTVFHKIWIDYNGSDQSIAVYITDQLDQHQIVQKPRNPALTSTDLDLSKIVNQKSYFGFAASTGDSTELHCVLSWNLTVELLKDEESTTTAASTSVKIAIPVTVGAVIVLIFAGLWFRRYRNRQKRPDPNIMGALKSLPGTPREFEMRELKKATNNFEEKMKLGQGGYGVVYRGRLATENLEIAVKKFTRDDEHESRDAIKSKDDFLAELTIINRLRHKNLVKLLGWCHKNRMLLLVYEYMPNGSLDKHIFCGEGKTSLSWKLRYQALSGVASALQYLHYEYDEKVIHRDLKASNILLDQHFNARLGDFGLARALDPEKTSYAEMEGVHGTMGYIAPECFHTGKATRESDVYGFGAVILEVACGLRPWTKQGGYQCLVDWVWSLHREQRILEAVDERLKKDYVAEDAERVLLLGLACSHPIATERPKTHAIVQILSGSVPAPHVPSFKPAFIWPSMGPLGDTSSEMTADTTPIPTSHFEPGWTPRSVSPHSGFTDRFMV